MTQSQAFFGDKTYWIEKCIRYYANCEGYQTKFDRKALQQVI